MTTYRIEHPEKGLIEYRDRKRWWWTLAILWSLFPVPVAASYAMTENIWILVLPLVVYFILVPLIDYCVGTDRTNPPEELVPALEADPFYMRLLMIAVPMHFIAIIAGAWLISSYSLPLVLYILFAAVMGMNSGLAINSAHELGHKSSKLARLFSRVSLAATGYGHFCIEHNLGHHRDVSTPEDPASARMGESVYRFMVREVPGAMKRGWHAEAQRLQKRGLNTWSVDNHILQSYAVTLVFQGGLIAVLGWIVLPFLLIHNLMAWFQLTCANYIEHYGLLREKRADGRYEKCQPHHSWNANHIFSNLILFQLERHSDHHANPKRSYQSLRSFNDLPELPSGYLGMYALAYCPAAWFKVMDKRLLAIPHINGDLNKVNIDPRQEARLRAMYASN